MFYHADKTKEKILKIESKLSHFKIQDMTILAHFEDF